LRYVPSIGGKILIIWSTWVFQ